MFYGIWSHSPLVHTLFDPRDISYGILLCITVILVLATDLVPL
jgi:hypothetical protein